ncbi:MAG: purine-nucleoside phosphorylase [bacterium]
MVDLDFKYNELIEKLKSVIPFQPELGIILGSGLGDFAESVSTELSIPTSSLPGYPSSTVQGHKGYIHFSTYKGKKLILFQGRIHPYEGYPLSECILPAYIAVAFKIKNLIVTNAAGGMNSLFRPGDLMLISSFNLIAMKKELSQLLGTGTIEQKNRMLNFPSVSLNSTIEKAATEEMIKLRHGVYCYAKGPSYETPSEIKMMRSMGSDAAGMSTVHEALFAAISGIEVSAISCITNFAAGISGEKLSHKEVMETADRARLTFERLLKKAIELI